MRLRSRQEVKCPLCISIRPLDRRGRLVRHLGLRKDPADPTRYLPCPGSRRTPDEVAKDS